MIIVTFAVCWLLGLWLGATAPLSSQAWSIVAGAGLVGGVLFQRRDERMAIAFACFCALGAGGVRYQLARPVFDDSHVVAYNDSRQLTIHGVVTREPDVRDRSIQLTVAVDSVTLRDGTTRPAHGLVRVSTFRFPEIPYGARISATGRLETPTEEAEFSYKAWLARQGVYSVMFLPEVTVGDFAGNPVIGTLVGFKARAQATLYRIMADPQASLLNAILLGNDNGLTEQLQDDFRTAGLAHLIVISGFHVSILLAVFLGLGEPLFGRTGAVWFTIAALILYMLFVGAAPSVMRATIMGVIYLVGSRLLGRQGSSLVGLALAAVLMTAFDPFTLWHVGFQLSFAATLGLILYAAPLDRWVQRRLQRVLPRAAVRGWAGLPARIVMVSLAAQVLTIPLVMFHFQQVALISLLANALVVPAQPLAMTTGGLALVLGLLAPPLGQAVGWVAWLFLAYTIWLVRLLAQIPFATVPATITVSGLAALYAAIGVATWLARQEETRRGEVIGRIRANISTRVAFGFTGLAAVLTIAWAATQPDGLLHVYFFDVGQGDAILIQTPSGRQILVDGGYYPTVTNDQLGRHMPFWDRTLDLVIATHPDADHVTGLPGVFSRYRVDQLITDGSGSGRSEIYDAVLLSAAANAIPLRPALAGETIAIADGVVLEVVHPTDAPLETSRNDNSVVLRLRYGDFSLLLTGDLEDVGERAVLTRGHPVQALVLKAGHHGARTSSSDPFLDAVQPQIAVISAGAENRFGHPHPETLARFAERGIAVLSTIDLGTIELISDGTQMWWQAHR